MNNLKRIQNAIVANDLDAVLLIDPLNRYYAAGFHTSDGAVLITREKGYYITDSRYIEAAHNALDGLVEVILNDRAHPIGKILRQGRTVALTKAGETLRPEAERILMLMEEVKEKVKNS